MTHDLIAIILTENLQSVDHGAICWVAIVWSDAEFGFSALFTQQCRHGGPGRLRQCLHGEESRVGYLALSAQ